MWSVPSSGRELRVSPDCFAVGYDTDTNGNNLTDVTEQWNGSTWTIVPAAMTGQTFDQLLGVQCPSADNCWAVGNAGPAQQMSDFLPIFPGRGREPGPDRALGRIGLVGRAERERAGTHGGYLSGLACVSASDCWASGATTDGSGMASGILMEHWDGSTWIDASASVPGSTSPGLLAGISCVSATQCWAAGSTGLFNNGGSGARAAERGGVLERLVVVGTTESQVATASASSIRSVVCPTSGAWPTAAR